MKPLRTIGFLLLLLVRGSLALAQLHEVGDGSSGPVRAAHVTAELLAALSPEVHRGSNHLALVLHLEPGWHVYWSNAGDSGEPPSVEWNLPASVTVGKMQFAAPKRLPLGPLMDYGYEGTAVFPFDLSFDRPLQGKTPLHLQGHARWLVCREVCVPGKVLVGVSLQGGQVESRPGAATVIAAAIAAEPVAPPSASFAKVSGSRDHFTLQITTGQREQSAEFYPFGEDTLRNAAEQRVQPNAQGLLLTAERSDVSETLPPRITGVVQLSGNRTYVIDEPVVASAKPQTQVGAPDTTLVAAILLAVAGGLVLNLMPCVFPILFLKALSLVGSAADDRRRQRIHGFAYTLGILVSFWIIVAVLLILRAGGRQAGWGFQLQSPGFVVLMASLLFFMALSLAGQFDLGLSLTGKGDALTRKSGFAGSFFTGVLATVVATPCTAPLMGVAIGFALSQGALITFAIFTALALGLALPYLLLTLQPRGC